MKMGSSAARRGGRLRLCERSAHKGASPYHFWDCSLTPPSKVCSQACLSTILRSLFSEAACFLKQLSSSARTWANFKFHKSTRHRLLTRFSQHITPGNPSMDLADSKHETEHKSSCQVPQTQNAVTCFHTAPCFHKVVRLAVLLSVLLPRVSERFLPMFEFCMCFPCDLS